MIGRQQGVILGDARCQVFEELFAAADPAFGQIVVNPADGDVAVGQARAANFLEQVQDHLPFAEGV